MTSKNRCTVRGIINKFRHQFPQLSHLNQEQFMNTSSETLIDRTERLLTRDENYKVILEKLFLLDNQHFERYFIKYS